MFGPKKRGPKPETFLMKVEKIISIHFLLACLIFSVAFFSYFVFILLHFDAFGNMVSCA